MNVLVVFILIPAFIFIALKFQKRLNRFIVFMGFGLSIMLLITRHPDALTFLLVTVLFLLAVIYSEKRKLVEK